jgi:hypothetical protein
LLLGACGLGAILLGGATGQALPPPPEAAADEADISIAVYEQYFGDMLAQSLPEEWATDLHIDVKPDNQIETRSRIKMSFFGQTIEGDMAATVTLRARDGKLVIEMEQVEVLGFDISGVSDALASKFLDDVNELVNQQVQDGLGEGARITSVTTDDTRLVIEARLEP